MKESPIFLKSFETLEWILQHTNKFPKPQRFVMAKRIEEAALSFHDSLLMAAKRPEKRAALGEADSHLERLKVYNHPEATHDLSGTVSRQCGNESHSGFRTSEKVISSIPPRPLSQPEEGT